MSTVQHNDIAYFIDKNNNVLPYDDPNNLYYLNIKSSDGQILKYKIDLPLLRYLEMFNFRVNLKSSPIPEINYNRNAFGNYKSIKLYKIVLGIHPDIKCNCIFKDKDNSNFRRNNLIIIDSISHSQLPRSYYYQYYYLPDISILNCPVYFNQNNIQLYQNDIINYPIGVNGLNPTHTFINYRFLNQINQYNWHIHGYQRPKDFYVVTKINMNNTSKKLYLHRFIMSLEYPNFNPLDASFIFVDHIDGNTMNNTIENLRFCSKSENGKNLHIYKTKYPGIRKRSQHVYYVAIKNNSDIREIIGTFSTLKEAVIARNNAISYYHKEFGTLIGYNPADEFKGNDWNQNPITGFDNYLTQYNDPNNF